MGDQPHGTHSSIGLAVSASGALRPGTDPPDGNEPLPRAVARRIERAFEGGLAAGLLHLASKELAEPLSRSLAFGRELAKLCLSTLRARGERIARMTPAADVGAPAEH